MRQKVHKRGRRASERRFGKYFKEKPGEFDDRWNSKYVFILFCFLRTDKTVLEFENGNYLSAHS